MRSLHLSVLFLTCAAFLAAQSRPAVIGRGIDENRRHSLAGNTRPEATARNDQGAVAADFPMEHMILQLARSAAGEQAVQQYIDSLHDPASPNYHRWMTASEFGAAFGVAEADRAAVTQWLESQGFTVNSIAPGGMTIDFSGTAAQVREAFHTEIHYLNVNGVRHIANMSDPDIPEALAPAVAGIVSLHDFSPRPLKRAHANYTFTSGKSTYQAVTPGDLATIYDLNPLFSSGFAGQGQTIAVIEDTDLYKTTDWNTFRSTFGLANYTTGSLTTVHPAPASGANNCSAPGVVAGDDGEAILDAEWASAAAPGAAIEVAACANTRTTFGGLIALQNLVNSKTPPSIVSISYGECEAENGVASNAAFYSTYQQAAALGISVFVAAGDEGAASCDAGAQGATHGIGVSAFASTPYNVAVGGTDFGDTVAGTNSTYWNSSNSATFASAKSYIPEIPWNDSCASGLLATHFGYSMVYGSAGFCGSSTAKNDGLLEVVAGSGGPSGCATGSPTSTGVVSGTCKGYTKPTWQVGPGVFADGARDIPDVSLFAGNGLWGHYYVDCWSDIRNGGASCAGAPSTWDGGGGTSYSAPIFAGIQALVNQYNGGKQGNPNQKYYELAALGGVFHGVTQGDIDVNCGGTTACFGATQSTAAAGGRGPRGGSGSNVSYNGALSTSATSLVPVYKAGAGWNFATGLGSVDAANLVTNWHLAK
ncbi:MAG: S53 family peptidase [Bryobacteraceae bacterium]|jgi:subtilase family serine protease